MKSGKKSGRSTRAGKAPSDPFADFLEDFNSDPDKPLKFLRSFMAGEDLYSPAVDVVEHEDHIAVIVDLPGVAEKDVRIEFVDGGVTVRGRREPADASAKVKMRRAERPAGSFEKTIPLPSGVDARSASVKFENGVLTLTLPRAAEANGNGHTKRLKAGTT